MSEDDKVKELPQKMFYLEILLRRGRMRSFCNTICNNLPTVWKINSKNPQLERKRFPKIDYHHIFPSKQLERSFDKPANKFTPKV